MAVAAKPARAAAKTEYRKQLPPRVHRRFKKRRNAKMIKALLCVVLPACLIGYVGTYAQVTRCGYHRADLQKQIRQAEIENQSVSGDIQALSSPGRLAAAATAAGMQPSQASLFVGPQESTRVAKAD